ncbi:LysR family transcriptional regulator [Paenibacillus selenitireducens]|uniref:LysR family transcriptional regulator n=1 Tax=Paenibacillus selenitireducens TaxID=1324314 RepID=A0A1T2X8G0_9BACL|nr:LysR family transcriptional regulator [Paenibacillus selenitireducens]OPA76132.1 LysR family transcriptional regulator [Paenibacillus selenitireducens]
MITDSLHIFVAVIEHSNFSRAAEALHISQPGVSMHIQNLEKELGAKLLHRTPKYVKLTEAGHILYQRAKLILSLYEEARTQIQLLHEVVTGTLNIGASFTVGEYVLPRLLASFVLLHPQVDVHVTIANTEEIVQGIRSKRLDLGLVEGDVHQPDMDVMYWQEDEMIVIAPPDHPLTRIQQVTSDLLQDQTWVYREPGSGTRAYSDRFLENHGLRVKRSYMLSSNQGVKESVISGLGLAVISRLVVQKELSNGELRELRLVGGRLTRALSILQDREPHEMLALHVFRKHLASTS